MTGTYRHTLDGKGRLFIPARLREELGDVFYVTISTDSCLTVYSNDSWERLNDKIRSLPRIKQKMMRPLYSHAAKCEPDSQGRVLLPQELRDYAGLTKNVAVVGTGDCAEIWDEDRWNEVDSSETSPESLAAAFRELDF